MTHSRLAPSFSKTWVHCTAAVGFIQHLQDNGLIPVEESSVYAEEGTCAHDWAADILMGDMFGSLDEPPAEIAEKDYDLEEMTRCVGDYVKFCQKITKEGDDVFIEKAVPLFYRPEDTGTVDYAAVSSEMVYIADLKYGKGVEVHAKDNTQLATYAMSIIEDLDIVYEFGDETLVTMAIYQPRLSSSLLPIKTWSLRLKELRVFCNDIAKAAEIITASTTFPETMEGITFAPSEDACQFCPARLRCDARKEHQATTFSRENIEAVNDLVDLDEEQIQEGEPALSLLPYRVLSDTQIACVVKYGPDLIKWINSTIKTAHESTQSGIPIDGLKLVAGKPGNREWLDEAQADTLLKNKLKADERYTKKLITLPQAEKLLKGKEQSSRFKNRFKELTFRKAAGTKLVPEDDPREALPISLDVDEVFDDLDAKEETN